MKNLSWTKLILVCMLPAFLLGVVLGELGYLDTIWGKLSYYACCFCWGYSASMQGWVKK